MWIAPAQVRIYNQNEQVHVTEILFPGDYYSAIKEQRTNACVISIFVRF